MLLDHPESAARSLCLAGIAGKSQTVAPGFHRPQLNSYFRSHPEFSTQVIRLSLAAPNCKSTEGVLPGRPGAEQRELGRRTAFHNLEYIVHVRDIEQKREPRIGVEQTHLAVAAFGGFAQ